MWVCEAAAIGFRYVSSAGSKRLRSYLYIKPEPSITGFVPVWALAPPLIHSLACHNARLSSDWRSLEEQANVASILGNIYSANILESTARNYRD